MKINLFEQKNIFFEDSSMDPLRLIGKEMIEIRPFLDIYSLEPIYVVTLIQKYVIINFI